MFGIDDAIIIGVAIGLASYFVMSGISGTPMTLKGALIAGFVGGISGAVTFGIGNWAEAIGNFYNRSGFQALSHGLFQGTLSGIQGGGFWTGLASGAVSSIASSAFSGGTSDVGPYMQKLHRGLSDIVGGNQMLGTTIFGTVMGGAGAALTKGNFWQGAFTGLVVSGLNHVAHAISTTANINSEIKQKYGSKSGSAAPVTQQIVDEMVEGLPTLKALHGNLKDLKVNANNLQDQSSRGANAHYFTNIEGATDASGGHYIELYRNSFASYKILAHTIVHEFGHAWSMVGGNFARTYAMTRRNWNKTMVYDEVFASDFAAKFGVPYDMNYIYNKRLINNH